MTLQQQAISAMRVIIERRDAYEKINDDISKLQPDFPQRVQAMDANVEWAFVDLLDAILGDNLASYYLYDMPKNGGTITNGKDVFKIRRLEDLLKYVERKK